jgi:hypothetical protein
MIGSRLKDKVATGLQTLSPKEFYLAFSFLVLIIALHTYGLIAAVFKSSGLEILVSPIILWLLIFIELALCLSAYGFAIRRPLGLLTSMISLLAVGIMYLGWYLYSRQIVQTLMRKPFYRLHPEAVATDPLGFAGAAWWNFTVLVTAVIFLAWEVKMLAPKASPSRRFRLEPAFTYGAIALVLVSGVAYQAVRNNIHHENLVRSPAGSLSLISPDNGGSISPEISFSWEGHPNSTGYALIISDVEKPEEPVVEKRGLTETSYKLSEEEFSRLLPGREYQWEIVGDTASGRQLFSPIRTFKVPSR